MPSEALALRSYGDCGALHQNWYRVEAKGINRISSLAAAVGFLYDFFFIKFNHYVVFFNFYRAALAASRGIVSLIFKLCLKYSAFIFILTLFNFDLFYNTFFNYVILSDTSVLESSALIFTISGIASPLRNNKYNLSNRKGNNYFHSSTRVQVGLFQATFGVLYNVPKSIGTRSDMITSIQQIQEGKLEKILVAGLDMLINPKDIDRPAYDLAGKVDRFVDSMDNYMSLSH